MSILIVRHGETPLNAARILQPPDTPLSARGQAQAQALARRLADYGLVGIVSSDLLRAQQTAQAVADATGLPVLTSALLQERNFGDLRGRAYEDLDFDPIAADDAPPGGESTATFDERVTQAFADVVQRRGALSGPLLVVTHGLVVRGFLGRFARLGVQHSAPEHIANTSLSIIAAQVPYAIDVLNCTAHLAGDLRDDPLSLSGG